MVNRFYEPETGRFTQADRLSFDPTQLTNAQNNRWTYCGGDPVNQSDPTGLYAQFFFFFGVVIGLGVGITIGLELVLFGTSSVLAAILAAIGTFFAAIAADGIAYGCGLEYESYLAAQIRQLLLLLRAAGSGEILATLAIAPGAFLIGLIVGIAVGLAIGAGIAGAYIF